MTDLSGIDYFAGKYAFLSNFYKHSQIPVVLYGYPTTEHFYQAMKTTDQTARRIFKDKDRSPGWAKRQGRMLALRPDWEEIRDHVMLTAVRRKFTIPSLQVLLLNTGDRYLTEGTHWHDNYWGDCRCRNARGDHPECLEKGQNKLGLILMQVRKEIK